MTKRTVVVKTHLEFRQSTSALLVSHANEFRCVIRIRYAGKEVNAKSLLGVLAMDITFGTELIITADGEDEAEAINTLQAFLEG